MGKQPALLVVVLFAAALPAEELRVADQSAVLLNVAVLPLVSVSLVVDDLPEAAMTLAAAVVVGAAAAEYQMKKTCASPGSGHP